VTTSVSKQLEFLHDRMPVIFDPKSPAIQEWLDPNRRWDEGLHKLLRPYGSPLDCYVVPQGVGKVGNNSPTFILPLDSAENKSNIKNFFAKNEEKKKGILKVDSEKVSKEEHADDVISNCIVETHDSKSVDKVNSENNAPLPYPVSQSDTSTSAEEVKKRPMTESEAEADNQMSKNPSPGQSSPSKLTNSKAQDVYSSKTLGKGPKKGVSAPPPTKKRKMTSPPSGNKSITSFFHKD
jgi:hypothetical protein